MANKQGEKMQLTDDERESLIDTATQLSAMSQSPAVRRVWWGFLKKHISERSPEQIARMEVAKGLRAA
jgi:hypothetical protein